MKSTTTLEGSVHSQRGGQGAPRDLLGLAIVMAPPDGSRPGEVLLVPEGEPGQTFVFGRGPKRADDGGERLLPMRQRPGHNEPSDPIDNPFVSGRHLLVRREGDGLRVDCCGRKPMLVAGREVTTALVRPGDVLEIKNLLLFLCVRRPSVLPPLQHYARDPLGPFGRQDADGIVGESERAWELRDRVAFAGARNAHVLVLGESGSGKELVARAIHAASSRRARKLVARNAATLPHGILDAELFGNAANYPNAGMPERPGLVGEADGTTLLLDEIGELPLELQTHLLRVLDDGGEYQRLGDARRRTSSFRLIGATNRPVSALRPDLVARLALRVQTPGLNDRREDILLVARHLLSRIAEGDAHVAQRFLAGGEPRIGIELARALVSHTYTTHARELSALLWLSLETSKGGFLDLTEEVRAELARPEAEGAAPRAEREITEKELREALGRHGGVQAKVWRELGLGSRFVLHRLLKKYGITPRDD
jgi:two-component system nitrogen regulation response regulator GlnG/two-component system response regulator HydG